MIARRGNRALVVRFSASFSDAGPLRTETLTMSRIAKEPIELPKGVEFKHSGFVVSRKGSNGEVSVELNSDVELKQEECVLTFTPRSG